MKIFRTLLLSLALPLLLTACDRNEAIPVCPSLPQETVGGLPSALVRAPAMGIQYQDEEFLSQVTLTPSVHTYPLDSAFPAGTRPCEQENLCTVMLADTVGEVRLAYFPEEMNAIENAEFYAAEALTGLTLTAYPAAEDGTVDLTLEKAQTIPVANGRFTLLVGRYYYELKVPQDGGTLTYGLIAYRIDAEKYEITWQQTTPCLVEGISEDPDVRLKSIPRFTVHRPFGHTGWNPFVLSVGGVGSWTYQNYAGTDVTILWDHGDPIKQFNIITLESTQLAFPYEIEYGVANRNHQQVEKTVYTRYAHDGTLLENEVEIPHGKISLQGNSYYVFTVIYENGSVQYLLKTGSADFTTHPNDDPKLPPLTAALLRQSYHNYILPYNSPITVDDIWIEQYLGTFSGCQTIFIGSPEAYNQAPREVSVGAYLLTFESDRKLYLAYKTRLYTVTEAYEAGLIDDRGIYDLGIALNGESFLQRYPSPPAEDTGD